MANWVNQELCLLGEKDVLDAWCKRAITGNFRADHALADEPTIRFAQVCPVRARDKALCTAEHRDGVIFRFCRTRVQAFVKIQTTWDHPRHFYLQRMARDWPGLSFCCAVNEDMGSFGGLIACIDGTVVDAVEDYDTDYEPREHRQRIRILQRKWQALIEADRPWRVVVPLKWRSRTVVDMDATFDDYARVFCFRSESECRRFASRRQGARVINASRSRQRTKTRPKQRV